MLGEGSTRGIALFAFVVAILALAVPVVVYVVTRPRLRLSVSNAGVGVERVADPQRGGEGTATFTFVEIVAHNDGGRTAVIEHWGVARYPGTDRENLWRDATVDVPRRLGVQPHDWKTWRATLLSPDRVNVPPEEAWSDVDITVDYRQFFFSEPRAISHHGKLGPWRAAAEGSVPEMP